MLNDISGQSEGIQFLKRVVARESTPPLLLVGDSGVGRRYSVIQAAKEIYCQGTHTNQCGCPDCFQIDRGIHPDIKIITSPIDKEIGVDSIRQVISEAYLSPSMAPIRFVIIDGVERLTVAAANALLKTLEEPPRTTLFFLLSESYDQILPTIRSRCGRVPYHKLPESFIIQKILPFEADVVKALVYARISEGSVGRALQYWGSNRLKLRDQVYTLFQHSVERDLSSLFSVIDEIGTELSSSLKFIEHLLHDLLIIPLDPTRVINQDLQDQLNQMRKRGTDRHWMQLRAEMKLVHQRHASSYINLAFHVKSAFVSAFFI